MAGSGMGSKFNSVEPIIIAIMINKLIIAIFFTSPPLQQIKKPSFPSRQLGYLSAQKYISLMRPVAFRHPISRVLAFSWAVKRNYLSTYLCKIYANSNGFIIWYIFHIVMRIMWKIGAKNQTQNCVVVKQTT